MYELCVALLIAGLSVSQELMRHVQQYHLNAATSSSSSPSNTPSVATHKSTGMSAQLILQHQRQQQQQQQSVPAGSVAVAQHDSYSPSVNNRQLITPPADMVFIGPGDSSPKGAVDSGLDRAIRPIGGERYSKSPSVFRDSASDIWGTNKHKGNRGNTFDTPIYHDFLW